jgi:hypothetical protein
VIWRTPFRTRGSSLPPSVDGARGFRALRAGGGEHPRRSGIVLVILLATGDWRCGYCQVGWWWLSASPSGAGSHSRLTQRTQQSSGKQHQPTRQRRKPSTPTGAPGTASSGATIAIASGREVGGVSFRGYPIVELARSAFGNPAPKSTLTLRVVRFLRQPSSEAEDRRGHGDCEEVG